MGFFKKKILFVAKKNGAGHLPSTLAALDFSNKFCPSKKSCMEKVPPFSPIKKTKVLSWFNVPLHNLTYTGRHIPLTTLTPTNMETPKTSQTSCLKKMVGFSRKRAGFWSLEWIFHQEFWGGSIPKMKETGRLGAIYWVCHPPRIAIVTTRTIHHQKDWENPILGPIKLQLNQE